MSRARRSGPRAALAAAALLGACADDASPTPITPLGPPRVAAGSCVRAQLACRPTGAVDGVDDLAVEIDVVAARGGTPQDGSAWPPDPMAGEAASALYAFRWAARYAASVSLPDASGGGAIAVIRSQSDDGGYYVVYDDAAAAGLAGDVPGFRLTVAETAAASPYGAAHVARIDTPFWATLRPDRDPASPPPPIDLWCVAPTGAAWQWGSCP